MNVSHVTKDESCTGGDGNGFNMEAEFTRHDRVLEAPTRVVKDNSHVVIPPENFSSPKTQDPQRSTGTPATESNSLSDLLTSNPV